MNKLCLYLLVLVGGGLGCGADGSSKPPSADSILDALDAPEASPPETDGDSQPPLFYPATQPGPYRVGGFEYTFVDPPRQRELPGTVWYPTISTEGERLSYLDNLIPSGEVFKNASIAADGPFPLVVFSHGNQVVHQQSYFLTEYLASHGYIVVGCDHIDNTFFTYSTKYFLKSAHDRPRDLTLLIDTLLQWNTTPGHPLEGKVDYTRIGSLGHSYGGYSVVALAGAPVDVDIIVDLCNSMSKDDWNEEWQFCHEFTEADRTYTDGCKPCDLGDDRVGTVVSITPGFPQLFEPSALAAIDVPILIMAGELDSVTPAPYHAGLYFDALTHAESCYWELAHASHFAFSNACQISFLSTPEYGCSDEFIDSQRGHELIRTATCAWLGLHLRQDERYRRYFEADYLALAPEVTLELK